MSLHPEELARLEAARTWTSRGVKPKPVLTVAPRRPGPAIVWYTGQRAPNRWVSVGEVLTPTVALLRDLGAPCAVRVGWRADLQQLILRRLDGDAPKKQPGLLRFTPTSPTIRSGAVQRWLQQAGVPAGRWKAWVRVAEDGSREIVVDCRTPAKEGRRDG